MLSGVTNTTTTTTANITTTTSCEMLLSLIQAVLLEDHTKELKRVLHPGARRLNWNSLGIYDYISKCVAVNLLKRQFFFSVCIECLHKRLNGPRSCLGPKNHVNRRGFWSARGGEGWVSEEWGRNCAICTTQEELGPKAYCIEPRSRPPTARERIQCSFRSITLAACNAFCLAVQQ